MDSELVPSYLELIFVARALERIGDDANQYRGGILLGKDLVEVITGAKWCDCSLRKQRRGRTVSSNVTSEASNVRPGRKPEWFRDSIALALAMTKLRTLRSLLSEARENN